MATIVTVNTSDKVILPLAREGYTRKTSHGLDWIEARVGIFCTFVAYTNSDAACVLETMAFHSYEDKFTFGLKDSSNNAPFAAGSRFLGLTENGTLRLTSNSAGSGDLGGDSGSFRYRFAGVDGVNETAGAFSPSTGTGISIPQYSSTTVNLFMGMKMVVSNPGLSNQTVMISFSFNGPVADVSLGNLRTKLRTDSYSTSGQTAITWNAASVALPMPNYFWVRTPFYNNRVRISCYGALKIS